MDSAATSPIAAASSGLSLLLHRLPGESHDHLRQAWCRRCPDVLRRALRELHRRGMDRPVGAAISRMSRRSTARSSARWPGPPTPISRRHWTPRTRRPLSGKTAVAERAVLLNKIADVIDANLEPIAPRSRGTTASRCVKRSMPIFLWRWTISGISPRRSAPGRLDLRDRRRHRRLPLPGTSGRGGTDHPLELP